MVGLRFICFVCVLGFIPSLAFGSVVEFPNAGKVHLSDGTYGRVVGVTAFDSNNKTVSAVIDARDKFGNPVRIKRALKAIPSSLARFGRTCIRGGYSGLFQCAAYSAIAAAAAYEGYDIFDGYLSSSKFSNGECPSDLVPLENADGKTVVTWVGIPCTDTSYSSKVVHYTDRPNSDLASWATSPSWTVSINRWYAPWSSPSSPRYGTLYVYNRQLGHSSDVENDVPVVQRELTDSDVAELVFRNAESLQIDSGLYPNVWEPVSVDELNENPGEGTLPDPDGSLGSDNSLAPDSGLEAEDMVTVSDIDETVVDLTSFYDWGSGWLPKSCPAPVSFSLSGGTFEFSYSVLCSSVSTYVAPMIRFVAIMMFLNILIVGGVRD